MSSKTKTVAINIKVLQLTETSFVGATELGGITVRGRRSSDELGAVRATLIALADANNDDAMLALELEIAGDTIGQALGNVDAGDDGYKQLLYDQATRPDGES